MTVGAFLSNRGVRGVTVLMFAAATLKMAPSLAADHLAADDVRAIVAAALAA